MLHGFVEIQESPIDGLGVFALRYMQAGLCIPVYGYLTSKLSKYCFEWDEFTVFEPYAPFKYLNHSDNPNVEIGCDEDNGFYLEVIEDIYPGEELTIYYGWDIEEEA